MERRDNIAHRSTSMAEIEADLSRIETQFDFALEEASLRGRPASLSANIELTSHMLSNMESGLGDSTTDDSTTYTPRQYQ